MATPIVVAVIKTPVIMVSDGDGDDDVDYIVSIVCTMAMANATATAMATQLATVCVMAMTMAVAMATEMVIVLFQSSSPLPSNCHFCRHHYCCRPCCRYRHRHCPSSFCKIIALTKLKTFSNNADTVHIRHLS